MAGSGANYCYTHHEKVETLRFRVVAASILLCIVFTLCCMKAAMIALSPDLLEAELAAGNPMVKTILRFRHDSARFLMVVGLMTTLATLFLGDLTEAAMPSIWGKIGVALTIAIIAEVVADYVGIKFKMKIAHGLAPLAQLLFDLLIVVKPLSWLITRLLGHEEQEQLKEGVLAHMVRKQWGRTDGELADDEAHGLLHIMTTDHLKMKELGNPIDSTSMVKWARFEDGLPVIPDRSSEEHTRLVGQIGASMKRWFVFLDQTG